MAKAKKDDAAVTTIAEKPTEQEASLTAEQLSLAKRAVMACTGFGAPEAEKRINELGPAKVRKIAELEAAKKRPEIVAILF